jgi:hypothetical protein
MKLHKLRPGPIREFPALTHNELVSEVEGLRRQLTELVDHRSPKSKSPVLVQLIWLGDELLAPGRSVKLAAAAFDPTSVESAPFSGLTFFCTEFEEGDQLDKYAIAAGPIAAATSADGTLSTRTDDDTGTLTMSGGHGIETGDTIVLQWDGGARYSVEVGTVAGNSVPIDNGRGDVLPDAMTPVTVIRSAEIGYGVIPEAYWAKVDVTDDTHTRAIAAAGTLLSSAASGGIPIIWKPSGTGEKWCVVSIVSREDRLVAADPTDGVPRELIDKLANTSVFDPEEHQLVYGQLRLDAINTPPDNTVRLFTAKSEGSETERFRLFELWDRKYLVEGAATVRWLDHNLQPNLGEEPETISDELHVFAGAAAGYEPWQSEMTRGMRGIAELWNDRPHSVSGTLTTRTDDDTGVLTLSAMHGVMDGNTVDVFWGEDGEFSRLGMTVGTVATNDVPIDGGTGDNLPTVSTAVHVVNQNAVLGDPLWKIVAMEGFAAWLKGTIDFDDGPEIFQIQTSAIKQDHGWDHVIPVSTGGIVPLADDSDIYSPFDGDKVLALLDDPDTDPPTYLVEKVNHAGRRVRGTVVDPGDGYVSKADGSFQIENLTEVYGGAVPSEPLTVFQTFAQGFVAGQATEAIYNETANRWECLPLPRKSLASIFEDNNGFNYVVADQLAGAGLAVEVGTGPPKTDGTGNTDKLKVAAPPTSEGGGVVAVNSVESVDVSIDSGGQLSVQINYTTKYVYGSGGSGGNVSDNADVWNKATPTIVSDVECVEGSIQVTSSGATEYLTPP